MSIEGRITKLEAVIGNAADEAGRTEWFRLMRKGMHTSVYRHVKAELDGEETDLPENLPFILAAGGDVFRGNVEYARMLESKGIPSVCDCKDCNPQPWP
jgi:hypothetical protein